jgi:hypothetical protein
MATQKNATHKHMEALLNNENWNDVGIGDANVTILTEI